VKSALHLNLHREFFDAIAAGTERVEYRKRTPYWRKRLEGRKYDVIKFRNGYATNAPEMIVQFRGVRKRHRKYEILLGRVLQTKRWKPPKASKSQIARARAYISSMDWEFSRSMPQWPHWYVLKEDGSVREFDFVARLVKRLGYPDAWGARTDYYLVIGKFKYWAIDNVLNRATPISNAEMRKRGLRYAAHHGKKSDLTED